MSEQKTSSLFVFIFGVFLGLLIALLFFTKEGKDIKKHLSEILKKLKDKGLEKIKETSEFYEENKDFIIKSDEN